LLISSPAKGAKIARKIKNIKRCARYRSNQNSKLIRKGMQMEIRRKLSALTINNFQICEYRRFNKTSSPSKNFFHHPCKKMNQTEEELNGNGKR
jgi:hypothetical protein